MIYAADRRGRPGDATEHPAFLDFYERDEVRVHLLWRITGRYPGRNRIQPSLRQVRCDHREDKEPQTLPPFLRSIWKRCHTSRSRIISIQYFQQHKRIPEKRELIEMYYGEAIGPVSLSSASTVFKRI